MKVNLSNLLIILFLAIHFSLKAQTITQVHNNGEVTSQVHVELERVHDTHHKKIYKYYTRIEFTINRLEQAENYRGFVIYDPHVSKIEFDLKKLGYESFTRDFSIHHKEKPIYTFSDTVKAEKVKLHVEKVKVIYESKINLSKHEVDSYYSSKVRLCDLKNSLNLLYFNDPELIENENEDLNAIQYELEAIERKGFIEKLRLERNDPINYIYHLKETKRTLFDTKKKCEYALNNWHIMYYEYGLRAYNNDKKREYFEKAIQKANSRGIRFAEPYYQLALISNYDDAVDYLDDAMKSSPSLDIADKCRGLYYSIYSSYIQKGDNQYGEAALVWYDKADKICDKNVLRNNCAQEIKSKIFNKLSIQYSDNVKSALVLVETDKYKSAFDNLMKIKQFVGKYYNILTYDKLKIAFQRFYDKQAGKVNISIDNKSFSIALIELTELENYIPDAGIEYENRNQIDVLYQKLFDNILKQAVNNNNSNQYKDALSLLALSKKVLAKSISIKYDDNELDKTYRTAHEGNFKQKLDEINSQLKSGNFSQAKSNLNSLLDYRKSNSRWLDDEKDDVIFETIFKQIKTYNLSAHYDDALYCVALSDIIVNQCSALKYDSKELTATTKTSHLGYFKHEMEEIRRKIKNLNFEDAENKLFVLSSYQKTNNEWLNDDSEKLILDEFQKLFISLIDNGYKQLKAAVYADALTNFQQAYGIKKYNKQNSLENKLLKGLCNANLNIGKQEDFQENYQAALDKYQAARNNIKYYEGDDKEKLTEELTKLEFVSVKNIIKQHIEKNTELLQKNRTIDAINKVKTDFKAIDELSNKYGYKPDEEIKKLYEDIQRIVFENECFNQTEAYNKNLQLAQEEFNKKSFINGMKYIDLAIETANKISACNTNTDQAISMQKINKPAADFQTLQNTIQQNFANSKYEELILNYKKLDEMYFKEHIHDFGIMYTNFENFTLANSNAEYIRYCSIYFCNDESRLSFVNQLLKLLFDRNFNSKPYYYTLGREIAEKNKAFFKNDDYTSTFKQYNVLDNRRFKFFKKGYKEFYKGTVTKRFMKR